MFKNLNKNNIKFCLKYPFLILVTTLSLSALLISSLFLGYLEQDDNMINLLPDDIGSRITFQEIQDNFELTEYMYVAIGNENQKLFDYDNLDYTQQILKDIHIITKNLEDKNSVDRVVSISTIYDMNSGKELMENFDPSQGPLDITEIKRIEEFLNDNKIIKKRLISTDGSYANLIVIPLHNEVYVQLSDEIHSITKKYERNYKFHYGGQAYVTGAVPRMVSQEVQVLLLYGVLLMSLILYINIRNLKAVFLILLTIVLSLGGMMGFMGWVHHLFKSTTGNFYFTMMNTSMPIVLLTIANSDGVHIITRFFKELRKLKQKELAIISTMENLALPIFLTSITTSMAFLMLIFSPVGAMLGYGVTLAFGIMWAWLLSNTFLVSFISLFNWDVTSKAINKPNYIEKIMKRFGRIVTKKPKKVLLAGSFLVILSIIGIFFMKVEVQYTEMFRKGNVIRDSAEFLDEKMMGNVNLIIRASIKDRSLIEPFTEPEYLKEIEHLQYYLDEFENVTSTISFIDVVKQSNKTFMGNNHNFYTIPESDSFVDINNNGIWDDGEFIIDDYNNNGIIEIGEFEDCGTDWVCPEARSYEGPDVNGTEGNEKFDLPEPYIDNDGDGNYTDGKGRINYAVGEFVPYDQLKPVINYDRNTIIITALMKTFSTSKVDDYEKMIWDFIHSIESENIKYELTGMMVFIVDFMWLVIYSSAWGIIYSVGIIFLLSTIFFKSWRYGILSTIPLIAAVFLNFGLMGWFGIELTHLTALLSSIIIGVGVDFSIHYIAEYKKIKKETETMSITSDEISLKTIDNVGYPIVLDAWSNMGFGALLLSSIIPLGQIGGLMVFAMIATSVGALTLLASALELFKNKIK